MTQKRIGQPICGRALSLRDKMRIDLQGDSGTSVTKPMLDFCNRCAVGDHGGSATVSQSMKCHPAQPRSLKSWVEMDP